MVIDMADYKGAKCISCGQVFKDGDDIVVCPECGTPYHRECYEKEEKCINTELHANGGSWHSDVKAADGYVHTGDGKVICPVCGGENDERAPFCTRCGHPLGIASQVKDEEYSRPGTDPDDMTGNLSGSDLAAFMINYSDPLCGYDPNEKFGDTRVCEMADYIGSNTQYYLPVFKHFKLTGRKLSFNLAAMVAPELYFANRKMLLPAIFCLFMRFFLNIPDYIAMGASKTVYLGFLSDIASRFDTMSVAFQILSAMFSVLSIAFMMGTCCLANWLYYRKVLKAVPKIRKNTPPQYLRNTLSSKGGTSPLAMSLMIVLVVGIVFGFSAYFTAVSAG